LIDPGSGLVYGSSFEEVRPGVSLS
jgi:hypothetical protein